jgi:hypothetical protein
MKKECQNAAQQTKLRETIALDNDLETFRQKLLRAKKRISLISYSVAKHSRPHRRMQI